MDGLDRVPLVGVENSLGILDRSLATATHETTGIDAIRKRFREPATDRAWALLERVFAKIGENNVTIVQHTTLLRRNPQSGCQNRIRQRDGVAEPANRRG